MQRTGTFRLRSLAGSLAVAGSSLVVLFTAFLPWFRCDAAQQGADIGEVVPIDQNGWSSLLGRFAVLSCVAGGVLALLPFGATPGLYVAPSVAGTVLTLARLSVAPSSILFGETLSYSRTIWLMVAAAFAVMQAGCAVLSASRGNQERTVERPKEERPGDQRRIGHNVPRP